jgi:hypothetical protein
MVWDSFTETTDKFIAALEDNADLGTFCITKYGKALSVKKMYKATTDVLSAELPLIMLTSPTQANEYVAARLLHRTHTVRLYCGLEQSDREKAQDELVDFEEYVEQAVLNDVNLNGPGVDIKFGSSTNDEGTAHPVYFITKDFLVLIERSI